MCYPLTKTNPTLMEPWMTIKLFMQVWLLLISKRRFKLKGMKLIFTVKINQGYLFLITVMMINWGWVAESYNKTLQSPICYRSQKRNQLTLRMPYRICRKWWKMICQLQIREIMILRGCQNKWLITISQILQINIITSHKNTMTAQDC